MSALHHPDTPLGRALASRAPGSSAPVRNRSGGPESLDLTNPEAQETAAFIREAAKAALERGETHYTARTGIVPLRQAIAEMSTAGGFPATAESAAITNGAAEALYIALQALIEPGDEVIVPDPRYPSYDAAIHLAEIAIEHDLIVIADEIYENFVYDGAEHVSIATLPGMRERTITLGGLSKAYAMTGWRVGYITAPAEFIDAVSGLKAMVNIHAPTISQWAGVAALDGP